MRPMRAVELDRQRRAAGRGDAVVARQCDQRFQLRRFGLQRGQLARAVSSACGSAAFVVARRCRAAGVASVAVASRAVLATDLSAAAVGVVTSLADALAVSAGLRVRGPVRATRS